jgi:hypothetical protein
VLIEISAAQINRVPRKKFLAATRTFGFLIEPIVWRTHYRVAMTANDMGVIGRGLSGHRIS